MHGTALKQLIQHLEQWAPPSLQLDYDNSGLQVGDVNQQINGVLIAFDCTHNVINEAIAKHCNVIITHHPLLFKPLKRVSPTDPIAQMVIRMVQNNIALYAIHTNLDAIPNGVSFALAAQLGLQSVNILQPTKGQYYKIEVYSPQQSAESIRLALSHAGAGQIGNYSQCSYNLNGYGTFYGNADSTPAVGQALKLEMVDEVKIEMVFPSFKQSEVIAALKSVHPYQEPAFNIIPTQNQSHLSGFGACGYLPEKIGTKQFLLQVKDVLNAQGIRFSGSADWVQKVAVCGGAGSSLISTAKRWGADIFITSDIKYHEFFDGDEKMIVADVGHYESEVMILNTIFANVTKKFSNFAILISDTNTNPVHYLV